jgi:hypothetical protein
MTEKTNIETTGKSGARMLLIVLAVHLWSGCDRPKGDRLPGPCEAPMNGQDKNFQCSPIAKLLLLGNVLPWCGGLTCDDTTE